MRVVRYERAVRMSARALSPTYSNLHTILRNISASLRSRRRDSWGTVNKLFVAGVATERRMSIPDSLMASLRYDDMHIRAVPSFLSKTIVIPRNSCFSPRVTVILPKYRSILCMTLVTTSGSLCDTLLSSTYQTTVHCFPLIIAFATQES